MALEAAERFMSSPIGCLTLKGKFVDSTMDQEVNLREGYSFYLVNISCLPSSDHFNVIMDLDESIEDLLPYLAACLPTCTYVHGTGVINLMDAGHIVAIYPGRITVTDVVSLEEGERICEDYFRTITRVRNEQGTISPVYSRKPVINVLDIYRRLPKTNCGICHAPSCMAFAAKVFRRESPIASCTFLLDDRSAHGELFDLLRISGYEVP